MAIEQTGSTLSLGVNDSANTGTLSSTITVPADAIKVLVGMSCYQGTANGLAAMTFTKGGADSAMTKVTGGDASNSFWQGAMFWLDDPDTGSNKSLKWDWIGAGSSADSTVMGSVTFWKGCDDGVRDSDGQQSSGLPHDTPTLTAQTGDKIVGWAFGFCNNVEATVDTWDNLTLVAQATKFSGGDGAWGATDPSGNLSVGWSAGTNMSEGGVVAAVLMPPASTAEKQSFYAFRRRSVTR